MDRSGFAIRCPNCLEWNVWRDLSPDDVALDSKDEFIQILDAMKRAIAEGRVGSFSHRKLLRCNSPPWSCPVPFEAFICRTESDMSELVNQIEAWSSMREFRLYKADCRSRWEGQYYGILFSARPILRQPHLELEQLMDRDILSRLIVGLSVEIGWPLTIYAANSFRPKGKRTFLYWMPIEAYSKDRLIVPPRYNKFCYTCRELVVKQLVEDFKSNDFNTLNCPLGFAENGTCAGREPACMTTPQDWHHCPAFIEEYRKTSPCYNSDCNLIRRVEETWRIQGAAECFVSCRCWAGFTKVGIAITVHQYLVGVAITGQVFLDPKEIGTATKSLGSEDFLKRFESDLEKSKDVLISDEENQRKMKKSIFYVTKDDLDKKVAILCPRIEHISKVANSRYRDVRGRSESAFRDELLALIQDSKTEQDFFNRHILHLLERMREFWAFEAVYFAGYFPETKAVSVIALSTKNRSRAFGMPGKKQGTLDLKHQLSHPYPFLFRRNVPARMDQRLVRLLRIYRNATSDPQLQVPEGECYFCVAIPLSNETYAFVFAVRDQDVDHHPLHLDPAGVSILCQDSIFRTCKEVAYALGDIRHQEAREIEWRAFSAQASHRIGNEISSTGMLLDVLRNELMADPAWAKKWECKLTVMQACIMRAKEMLTMQAKLTAKINPQPEVTNLANLIKRASTGILQAGATLDFQGSAAHKDVFLDPVLMEQAFRELCVNAVRAAGKNVHLVVNVIEDTKEFHISFRDNGPGINSKDLERIFEPFVTLQHGGTGMGLATVRRIVEAHGGTIYLEESDSGADFVISLPQEGAKK